MSRGRPIEVEWKHSEAELRKLYNEEKHVERRTRYQALWLIRGGRSMKEVSEIVDRDYDTVRRWMSWYRDGGLSEVGQRLPGQAGGAHPSLTSKRRLDMPMNLRRCAMRDRQRQGQGETRSGCGMDEV